MAAPGGGHWVRRAVAAPWLVPLLAGWARTEENGSTLLGCYSYGYAYDHEMPNITGQPFGTDSAEECQQRCANTWGCSYFGFWQQSKACYLGDDTATMIIAQTLGAVSGPAVCPQESLSACSAVPGPEFPGPTPEVSHRSWPMGHQPTNLQCWPRTANGYPARCATEASVLEDTDAGWAGRCDGLRRVHVGADETCQSKCEESPLCAVWATNASAGNASACWHGLAGLQCESSSVPPPTRAQRLMHGSYRKLMNTMGMQVMNLVNAFGVMGNATEATQTCRMVCLSSLLCQHWQYSTDNGCWVESPTHQLTGYPLVTNPQVIRLDSQEARTFIAGEYIQHMCPNGPLESAEPGDVERGADNHSEAPLDVTLGIADGSGSSGGSEHTHSTTLWMCAAAALALVLAILCGREWWMAYKKRQTAGGTRAIERMGEDSLDYAYASDHGEDAYGMSPASEAPRPPSRRRGAAAPPEDAHAAAPSAREAQRWPSSAAAAAAPRGWAPAAPAASAPTPSYTPSFTASSPPATVHALLGAPSSFTASSPPATAHALAGAPVAPLATAPAFPHEALYREAVRSASSQQRVQASVPTTAATPLYSQTTPPQADGWLPPGSRYSGFGV